jgi:single-strand DNA-binding protein
MASYNRVIIAGNLTRDPEYKQLASGQPVCRLGIASNRQFKNRQSGDMVQEVCFIDVDVWGPQAESCRQYLRKGSPVLIEGRLKFDSWEDDNGQKRSKHTIVADRVIFLGAQQQDAALDEDMSRAQGNQPLDPSNQVEKELMDQIQGIKNKINAKKSADAVDMKIEAAQIEKPKAVSRSVKASVSDAVFNDEPPFQDDLPF